MEGSTVFTIVARVLDPNNPGTVTHVWLSFNSRLYVVERKHLPKNLQSNGRKVTTNQAREADISTVVSGVQCASYHGFPGVSLVLVGSNSFVIPDAVQTKAITVGMGKDSDYIISVCVPPAESRTVFRFFEKPNADTAFTGLHTFFDNVNAHHQKRFYQKCEVFAETDDGKKVTLILEDVLELVDVEKELLPPAPFTPGTVIWVSNSVLKAVDDFEEMKAAERLFKVSSTHAVSPRRTTVTIGETQFVIPVHREVACIVATRDDGGSVRVHVSSDESAPPTLVAKCASLEAFSELLVRLDEVNKVHLANFYQKGKITNLLQEYKYQAPISGPEKCDVATVKLEDGSIVISALLYLPHGKAEVGQTVYLQKTVVFHYRNYKDSVRSVSRAYVSEANHDHTEVRFPAKNLTLQWDNTRSPFVRHDRAAVRTLNSGLNCVFVEGEDGVKASVVETENKCEADSAALAVGELLSCIEDDRASRHYVRCETVNLDVSTRTAVVRAENDICYVLEFSAMPKDLGVDEPFLVPKTTLTKPFPANPCLEVYPDIEPGSSLHDDELPPLELVPDDKAKLVGDSEDATRLAVAASSAPITKLTLESEEHVLYYPNNRFLYIRGVTVVVPDCNEIAQHPPTSEISKERVVFYIGKSAALSIIQPERTTIYQRQTFAQNVVEWLLDLYLNGEFD